MSEKNVEKLAAVVLAAGAARRFGRPKQLERWPLLDSPTLVERAVNLILEAGLSQVYVVTGNQHAEVAKVLAKLQENTALQIIYNPRWEDGQGYSVAAGVAAVQETLPESKGILFMLADQPRLKVRTIEKLAEEFCNKDKPEGKILFPFYDGKRGNPVIFGREFFEELAKLEGDTGGRVVVKKYPTAAIEITVDDPAIHEDVDTSADLAALSLPEDES